MVNIPINAVPIPVGTLTTSQTVNRPSAAWTGSSGTLTGAENRRLQCRPVQHDVAVQPPARKPARPTALGVEVGELTRNRAEVAGEHVVEHPRLDRNAAARSGEHAQRPRLLGV